MDASERRGTAWALSAGCLAFVAWGFPEVSRFITIPGALICACLAVYFFWPEIKAALLWAARYGTVWLAAAGALLVAIILTIGHHKSVLQKAATLPPLPPTSAAKSAPPAPTQSGQLRSIMGDLIYSCDVPRPPTTSLDTMLFQQKLDYYAQTLKVLGNSIGASFSVKTIDGGVQIDVDAATGLRALKNPFHKAVMEVRRVGDVEMVNIKIEMPDLLKLIPVTSSNSGLIGVTNFVHKMLSLKDGTCHLV